jgi:hypothetical protein
LTYLYFISLTYRQLFSSVRAADEFLKGALRFRLKEVGIKSQYADLENIISSNPDLHFALPASELISLRPLDWENFGVLSSDAGDISLVVEWQSSTGASAEITIKYWNQSIATPTYSTALEVDTTTSTGSNYAFAIFSIGDVITAKSTNKLPWDLDEAMSLEWSIENTGAVTANIRNVWLVLDNCIVAGKYQIQKIPSDFFGVLLDLR